MRAARCEELDARCEIRVRALIRIQFVKQRPGRTSGAGVHTHSAYEAVSRDNTLADGTLFWVVFADSERISGGLAPHSLCRVVPRPACAFGSKEP
jgi:hypothetical protein